ncbi:hypothetical protein WJX73_002850 [Symbiochloris irregularis]|uniref:Uncharacterized protein n=1 Tax=Symbiochloris irregularis TaxID=706552 RepID=A0AAW1NS13_9CHLO
MPEAQCPAYLVHLECAKVYLGSGKGLKNKPSNSTYIAKAKDHMNKHTANALTMRGHTLCMVGRGKGEDEDGACKGVIKSSEQKHPLSKTWAAKKKAALPALPRPPPPAKKAELKKKAQEVTEPAARVKVPVDPELERQRALKAEAVKQLAPPPRKPAPASSGKPAVSYKAAVSQPEPQPQDEDGWTTVAMPARRKSAPKKTQHEHVPLQPDLLKEQIEVAVLQGKVPKTYRTSVCTSTATGTACPYGKSCSHAHSLKELRIEAAIEAGELPADFKTSLCGSLLGEGPCHHGMLCLDAHSVQELRVSAAIALHRLPEDYKTEMCRHKASSCPEGATCNDAHFAKKLRKEAAVQLKKQLPNFKSLFCVHHPLNKCHRGDTCTFAHGTKDLRLHASINAEAVPPNYRTRPCTTPGCQMPAECKGYHVIGGVPVDQLPLIREKGCFCSIKQETGHCPSGASCYFAHSADDLQVKLPDDFMELPLVSEPVYSSDALFAPDAQQHAAPRARTIGSEKSWSQQGTEKHPPNAIVPLSVQQNRLPYHPVDKPVTERSRQQQAQARAGAKLVLCAQFMELGQCRDANCAFAHGEDELRLRQERVKRGTESAGPAPERGSEPVWKHTASKFAAAAAKHQPIKQEVMDAIAKHRMDTTVTQLLGMSFSYAQAETAARASGANFDAALQLLLEGEATDQSAAGSRDDAGVINGVAASLKLDIDVIEAAILEFHGDIDAALEAVQENYIQPEASSDMYDDAQSFESLPSSAAASGLGSYRTDERSWTAVTAGRRRQQQQQQQQQSSRSAFEHKVASPESLIVDHTTPVPEPLTPSSSAGQEAAAGILFPGSLADHASRSCIAV